MSKPHPPQWPALVFWGAWGFALFGPTPLKRRVSASSGAFSRKPFLGNFSVFARCVFCGFWGFGFGAPLFGSSPLRRRALPAPCVAACLRTAWFWLCVSDRSCAAARLAQSEEHTLNIGRPQTRQGRRTPPAGLERAIFGLEVRRLVH